MYKYNQAQVNIDCYLSPEAFDKIPSVPLRRYGYGSLLFIVVMTEGIFKEVNPELLDEINSMSSCNYYEFFLKPGKYVSKTIDCFTWGGLATLYHENIDSLQADYNRLREMENLSDFLIFENSDSQ